MKIQIHKTDIVLTVVARENDYTRDSFSVYPDTLNGRPVWRVSDGRGAVRDDLHVDTLTQAMETAERLAVRACERRLAARREIDEWEAKSGERINEWRKPKAPSKIG